MKNDNKITWSSLMSFGKWENETLLNVLIKNKNYLRWCFRNELHFKYDELMFIYENVSRSEKKELGIYGG